MTGNAWDSQAFTYSDQLVIASRPTGIIAESYSYGMGPHQLSATSVLVSQRLYLVAVLYQKGQVVSNIGFGFGPSAAAGLTNWHTSLYAHDTLPYIVPSTISLTTTNGSTSTSGPLQPQNVQNRLITGTGIPGGAYVTGGAFGNITLSAAATASGTITATLGQFAATRAQLIHSSNSTSVPTVSQRNALAMSGNGFANTYTIPATGWYNHGIVINATTMPNMIEQAVLSTCPTYMNAEAPIKCGYSTTGITSASGLPAAQAAAITAGIDRLYSYST